MRNVRTSFAKGKPIYCGIDTHKDTWTVVVRCQREEIYRATIPADVERLVARLKGFEASEIHTVYEAGPTGYSLHDGLEKAGCDSMVVPPTKVPQVQDRVKTDHRDGRKLAEMLEGGHFRGITIPTLEQRAQRQLYRTREQVMKHRKQTQNQIKSMLLFHGVKPPAKLCTARWSQAYLRWLETLSWDQEELKVSMGALLNLYHHLDQMVKSLEQKFEALAKTGKHRENTQLTRTIPGIGIHTAMALAVELGDVSRFKKEALLPSYIGLTPSERSSGQRVRKGSITRCGNPRLRKLFVESSWTLIRRDPKARETYDRIKQHTGSGNKAIVAVARRLTLCVRRMLLDRVPYEMGMKGGAHKDPNQEQGQLLPAATAMMAHPGVKRYVLKKNTCEN